MAVAGLALLVVALNWLTTGHHLGATLERGLWGVAGVDLLLLGLAALASQVARRLTRHAPATAAQQPTTERAFPC